jgi:hypothetical protein
LTSPGLGLTGAAMAELPAAASAAPGPEKGPYTFNEVKTIEIAGPVKITLTTRSESSHVPPQAPSYGPGPDYVDALRPIAELILTKLEEIKRGQEPSL